MGQHRILDHIPVVGGEHILRTLVQDGIELIAGNVEGHGISAGIEVHLMEIFKIINVGQDAAGGRIVLQIIDHTVHLVHRLLALVELVLLAQLIAVSLADGAIFTGPLIPDMAAQIADPVGLLLPDPQQFIHGALPVSTAQGHNGKFFCQIIAVHNAEFLDGMGGSAILPTGAYIHTLIRKTIFQNIQTSLAVQFVSSAHDLTSEMIFALLYHNPIQMSRKKAPHAVRCF